MRCSCSAFHSSHSARLYCPSASITPAVTRTAAAPLRTRLDAVKSSRPNFGKNRVNNTPKANTNKVVVDETAETKCHRREERGESDAQAAAEIDQLICSVDTDNRDGAVFKEPHELLVISGNKKDARSKNTFAHEGPERGTPEGLLDREVFEENGRQRHDESRACHQKQQPRIEMLQEGPAVL